MEGNRLLPNLSIKKIWAKLTELNNKTTDYVMEQGVDGEWSYRKWSGGLFEAWRSSNTKASYSFPNTYGNRYYAGATDWSPSSKANQFVSVDYISITGISNGLVTYHPHAYSINDKGVLFSFYIANDSNVTIDICIKPYIRGRWK